MNMIRIALIAVCTMFCVEACQAQVQGNVTQMLNRQRATEGLSLLVNDPTLQAVAFRRAHAMAESRIKNHPPGSFAPGTHEGVGWSSSRNPTQVSACYTSASLFTRVGAAAVQGRDGTYFAVVYAGGPQGYNPPSGQLRSAVFNAPRRVITALFRIFRR